MSEYDGQHTEFHLNHNVGMYIVHDMCSMLIVPQSIRFAFVAVVVVCLFIITACSGKSFACDFIFEVI